MLAAETAGLALARVRPSIEAPRRSGGRGRRSMRRSHASDAVPALGAPARRGRGGAARDGRADAFVAFAGGDEATRDDALACVEINQ